MKHYLLETEHQAGKSTPVIAVEMGVAPGYFPDDAMEEHTQDQGFLFLFLSY